MLRWGKVSVKCYVVIDHTLATPTRLRILDSLFKYSYSIHTVMLLIKSNVLVLNVHLLHHGVSFIVHCLTFVLKSRTER